MAEGGTHDVPQGEEAGAQRQGLSSVSQYGVYNPYSRGGDRCWRDRYAAGAAAYWDAFYRRHKAKFFKHRRWLVNEFEVELGAGREPGPLALLEVGCGVGDTVFPLLETVDGLFVHCCDFSPTAVRCLVESPAYDSQRCHAFVHDLARGTPEPLASALGGTSVDLVSVIFVLSAIAPEQHSVAVRAMHGALRTGGRVLFRDYCAGDLSQVRFDAHGQALLPAEGEERVPGRGVSARGEGDAAMYVRQDGTATYYFTPEGLARLFCDQGQFKVVRQRVVNKVIENRKEQKAMARVWIQAVFEKQ